jgi:DNA modification methylase
MNKLNLYNKSSEDMPEIQDSSVDLIFTSPPYNIGTKYVDFRDATSFDEYKGMLLRVFSECYRVLNGGGKLIIEVADSVYMKGVYVALSGLMHSVCLDIGFYLEDRYINFIYSENGKEVLDHGWNEDYTTTKDSHSNCHQILVFNKNKIGFLENGKVIYNNYKPSNEHPCPFPKEHFDFILGKYFRKGFTVLDPFAGTSKLGSEVIKNGGNFIGYEIVKVFYDRALSNFSKKIDN